MVSSHGSVKAIAAHRARTGAYNADVERGTALARVTRLAYRLLFPAFLLVRLPRANILFRSTSHLTETAARIGSLRAFLGGRGRCRACRLGFGLARCRGRRRRRLLGLLDRRPRQELPCIGMVASNQTGLLLIAFDGETSAFLHRLDLVGDVAAEFLVERVLER